ncbi:MAG: hypothetical protein IPK22_22755 [Verrucomicrobiaceae bacterium]|nr:hypothetical protein [Verrucomicrobiaceae bacterium]
MKELYDQKLVRKLAAAVREHSPDDWLASRSMRRALLWQKAVQCLLIFCGLWMLTLFPNLPVIELGKAKTELPGAYGLSALLLVSGGLLLGFVLVGPKTFEVTPLIHMPASLRKIYLHVLDRVRKETREGLGLVLLFGVPLALTARLAGEVPFSITDAAQLAGVGVVLVGSCLAWLLLVPLFTRVPRLGMVAVLPPAASVAVLVWLLARTKFPSLPSPAFLGEALMFLPQAKLCEWFGQGGPMPLDAFFYCAAMLVFVLLALMHHVRDQQPEDLPEMTLDTPAATAEAMLAMHLREWRMHSKGMPSSHAIAPEEWLEEGDYLLKEEAGQDEEEEEPLQACEDAPQEHATLVTPEFRQRMAAMVRGHLEEKWSPEGLPSQLASWEPPLPEWSRVLRLAALVGALLSVVFELPGYFETGGSVRHHIENIGLVLVILTLFFPIGWWQPDAVWLPVMRRLGWLPVESQDTVSAFLRWDLRVLRRRFGYYAGAILTAVPVCFLFILIRSVAGISYSGAVTPGRFITGEYSLPNGIMILLGMLLGFRLFGIVAFAFKWTCLFGKVRLLPVVGQILLIISSVALIITACICFCVGVAADWANPIWLVALPAFPASELCVRWLLRSLVTVYRTSGDWKI